MAITPNEHSPVLMACIRGGTQGINEGHCNQDTALIQVIYA